MLTIPIKIFGIHKISTNRTYTYLNIYIFAPIMTKPLYNAYNNKINSVDDIHNKIERRQPNVIGCHIYPLVRMVPCC